MKFKRTRKKKSSAATSKLRIREVLSMQFQPNYDRLFKNPQLFVALVVGTPPGMLAGGIFGGFCGIYMTETWNLTIDAHMQLLVGVPLELVLFAFFGVCTGAIIGGIISGGITGMKAFFKGDPSLAITRENIWQVVLVYLSFSIKISLVLGVGATLGSLRAPGVGTVIGGFVSAVLYALIEKSNFNLRVN